VVDHTVFDAVELSRWSRLWRRRSTLQ